MTKKNIVYYWRKTSHKNSPFWRILGIGDADEHADEREPGGRRGREIDADNRSQRSSNSTVRTCAPTCCSNARSHGLSSLIGALDRFPQIRDTTALGEHELHSCVLPSAMVLTSFPSTESKVWELVRSAAFSGSSLPCPVFTAHVNQTQSRNRPRFR